MKKLLIALTAFILLLGGVGLAGLLFFIFFGISQEAMVMEESSASHAASSPADMERVEMEAPAEAMAKESQAAPVAPRSAAAPGLSSAAFSADAKVIRNGALSLVVDDPVHAVQDVEQIVAGISGAFIANAEVRQAGAGQPTALTLRVPAEAFDRAISALRALALEVLAEQVTARDVSEEYTDLDARLRNLQAAETQLLSLLERSDTVEDLLKVENRLAEVRQEIERLQGRLNLLEDRIALATIVVLLHGPPDVSVEISAQSVPSARSVTAFALTYRNDGSVAARNGTLTLQVPDRLSVIDLDQGGQYDPLSREVQWNLSDIPPGAVRAIFAHLRVESTESVVFLSADIQSDSADANDANNTASLALSFAPDLTLEVDGPASGAQGSEIPLWIFFTNVGTADANDVTIRATLPKGLTFVRADHGGSYASEQEVVEWKLGRLQANSGGQVAMNVRVDVAEGRLQVPIAIAAAQVDAVDFNNRTDIYLTALREDVSERSIWQPGQTLQASLDALIVVARTSVDVLIWVLTFGIPLALLGVIVLGVRAGMRRWRRGQSG